VDSTGPISHRASPRLYSQVGEGIRALIGDPLLRPIAASTATGNLFYNVLFAVYVLYATRELGIDPVWLGAIFAMVGVGGFMGALLAHRAAQRFGLGPTIICVPRRNSYSGGPARGWATFSGDPPANAGMAGGWAHDSGLQREPGQFAAGNNA